MPCLFAQAVRRIVPVLVVGLLLLGAHDGRAAEAADKPADKPVNKAEVQQLIQTIETPEARTKLVDQLKLLVAAQQAATPEEEPGLLSLMTDEITVIGDEGMALLSGVSGIGHLADWAIFQATDPQRRGLWAEVMGKFAVLFLAGLLAERGLMLLFRPLRRVLEQRDTANRWLRLPLVAGIWLLDVVPVALFLFVAHGLRALPALSLTGDPMQATVLINLGYVVTRFSLVSFRAVLLPSQAGARALPLSDETAIYLAIWAQRLTLTVVWGYFALQALKLLGLPKNAYGVSLKGLGLLVATLLVILVLQNRQGVADWLRTQGHDRGFGGKVQGLRNRLADIWHVLACLYIAGAFLIWALQVKGGIEYVVQASLLTVVVLVAGHLLNGVTARLVTRAFAINDDLRARLPHLEARANRYLAVMQSVLRGVIGLVVVLTVLQVWGLNALSWLSTELGRRLVSSSLSIAAVLLAALVVWELLSASVERYLSQTDSDGNVVKRSARARTLLPLLRNVVMVVLSAMVTLMVLSELGVNIAPLLAGAGVIGVAIGFGSQKLVQDVITGAFILFEDTIAVGDSVKIGDNSGVVEGMTIRTLKLRAGNGQLHTLPFSSVSTVVNMSRDFAFYVFNVSVSYHEDVDRVMAAMRGVGEAMREEPDWAAVLPAPVEVFGVDKFDGSAMVIGGRLKAIPGKEASAGREFNRRLMKRFAELGVEMPNSNTTLVLSHSEAAAAPFRNDRVEEFPADEEK